MRISIFLLVTFLCLLIACSKPSIEKEDEHHDDEQHEQGNLEISKEGQQRAGMQFAEVIQTKVQNSLTVTGKVVPDESRVVHVRPLTAGRIQEVFVKPGNDVKEGQQLATLDYVELGELESEYLKVRSKASVAEQALKRAENLVKIGAIAQSEYDRRNADYQELLASVRELEVKARRYGVDPRDVAELPAASRLLGQSILRSPSNGVLLKYDAAAGETAEPDRALFTIADLTTIWVEANVHETDLSLVEIGRDANIHSDAYPDSIFHGKITKIGDILDVATRTVQVRCQVPNIDRKLKIEMFVDVTIPTSETRDALVVPAIAVQEIDHKPVVFVKKSEDQFEKREIKLGEKMESGYEVVSGLSKNEQVVAQGSFSMKSEFLKAQIGSDEHGH